MTKQNDVILFETSQWILPSMPSYYKISGQFPLGLGYLAAMIMTEGASVEIMDLNMEQMSDDQLLQYLLERSPRIIGISSMSGNYPNARRVAMIAKKALNNVKVVCGGIHASLVPQRILEDCEAFDYVLSGEAEHSFRALVAALLYDKAINGIPGIWYRHGSKILTGQAPVYLNFLDELPLPAYEASYTSIDRYHHGFNSQKRTLTLISSRGCPHNCPYCSTTYFHGKTYRARSVRSILAEIEYLRQKHAIEKIIFVDDSFISDKKRLRMLCGKMAEEFPDLVWGCSARLNDLDDDILATMVSSGCDKIFIGVETLSEKLQRQIHKRISMDRLQQVVDGCSQHGVNLTLAFMLGFPNETADDRQMIIDFVNSNRNKVKDWRFSPLVIYPGTTFWNDHEHFGINLDGINEVEPVGLPRSYVRGVEWHDLLSDMVTLYRISLESQLKGKTLNPIIAPSVTFQ